LKGDGEDDEGDEDSEDVRKKLKVELHDEI
jgi:hypothetical protein